MIGVPLRAEQDCLARGSEDMEHAGSDADASSPCRTARTRFEPPSVINEDDQHYEARH